MIITLSETELRRKISDSLICLNIPASWSWMVDRIVRQSCTSGNTIFIFIKYGIHKYRIPSGPASNDCRQSLTILLRLGGTNPQSVPVCSCAVRSLLSTVVKLGVSWFSFNSHCPLSNCHHNHYNPYC